jgi:hypothetical protein
MCGLLADNKKNLAVPKAEFLSINMITRERMFSEMNFYALV